MAYWEAKVLVLTARPERHKSQPTGFSGLREATIAPTVTSITVSELPSHQSKMWVPVTLRDEDGVAHVRAIFRRMRQMGNLGPRGLDPDDTLELRGNGGGQKQATVETTLKVRDEHEPGDYLCVAIQAYDSEGNMMMIENPKPTKVFRIVDVGNKDDHKMEFLGWGED
jgi:hypothetical protein